MGKRILLVENEPTIAVLTRLELEDLGYKVEIAKEGSEAIRKTEVTHPDVVLMDFQLDGQLNGAETAAHILENHHIPVIFLTGRSDSDTIQKCLAVKPQGYLRKPCQRQELQQAIEHALFQQELSENSIQTPNDPLHDPVTGLPNRYLFIETLNTKLQAGAKDFAVLYLDINRFRQINDSIGYAGGDDFLKLFAATMEGGRGAGDCIARMGSDEFAILLNHVPDAQEALEQANRIRQLLDSPLKLKGESIFVTVSIGVAHALADYNDAETIVMDAETALHQAKAEGVSATALFNREMLSETQDSFHLANELRCAMASNQLTVYYQPIVRLNSYRIIGFEALLRWRHPQLGLINAADIIPVAEQTGLILPIGRWVMKEACQQLAEWHTLDRELSMHVNLSARHLMQDDLVPEIKSILKETGIPPQTLKIEIVENFVIDFREPVLQRLLDLQALNIGLQIDDFGKGYSSLSYLHQFPIEALKIDRSFIESTANKDASSEIVETIVHLGKKLRLQVIAEGVETDAQLRRVVKAGCNRAQGFLFSEPVDATTALRILENSELDDYPPFAA